MAKKYQLIHIKAHGKPLNVKVRKPQRYINNEQGRALARMFVDASARRKPILARKDCVVLFFRSGRGLKAVQRCERRKTFKSRSFAQAASRRAAAVCRREGYFCKKGSRRGRRRRR